MHPSMAARCFSSWSRSRPSPILRPSCRRERATRSDAHRMSYYAPRAAALGPVAAEVVAACFFHHPTALVRPAIPRAWQIADAYTILAAPEAVDGALRRSGAHGSPPRRWSRPPAWRARRRRRATWAGGCCMRRMRRCPGRNRRISSSGTPSHLLREHRGDGHIIRPRSRRRPLSATQHHPTPSLIDISWHCNEP